MRRVPETQVAGPVRLTFWKGFSVARKWACRRHQNRICRGGVRYRQNWRQRAVPLYPGPGDAADSRHGPGGSAARGHHPVCVPGSVGHGLVGRGSGDRDKPGRPGKSLGHPWAGAVHPEDSLKTVAAHTTGGRSGGDSPHAVGVDSDHPGACRQTGARRSAEDVLDAGPARLGCRSGGPGCHPGRCLDPRGEPRPDGVATLPAGPGCRGCRLAWLRPFLRALWVGHLRVFLLPAQARVPERMDGLVELVAPRRREPGHRCRGRAHWHRPGACACGVASVRTCHPGLVPRPRLPQARHPRVAADRGRVDGDRYPRASQPAFRRPPVGTGSGVVSR